MSSYHAHKYFEQMRELSPPEFSDFIDSLSRTKYVSISPLIVDHGASSGPDYRAGNLRKVIDDVGSDKAVIRVCSNLSVLTDLSIPENITLDLLSRGVTIIADGCVILHEGSVMSDTRSDIFTAINGGTAPVGFSWVNIVKVPTVDDVRERSGYPGQPLRVLGYSSVDDGGGGPLRFWKTGSPPGTYAHDGWRVHTPVGGDGSEAWVMEDVKEYKPEWAGLDVHKAAQAGDVILSGREDYIISQSINNGRSITGSGLVTFTGPSGWAITTSIPGATSRLEYAKLDGFELVGNTFGDGGIEVRTAAFTTVRNVLIRDFTKTGAWGLSVDGGTNGTVAGSWEGMYDHVLVRNCDSDIRVTATATGEPNENTFIRCSAGRVAKAGGYCWYINNGDNVTYVACEADGRSVATDLPHAYGFYFDGANVGGHTLINPRMEKCTVGISLLQGAGYALVNPQYFSNTLNENFVIDKSKINNLRANGFISNREFFTEFQTMNFFLDTVNSGTGEAFSVYKNSDDTGTAVKLFGLDENGKTEWTSNKSNTSDVTGATTLNVDGKSFIRLTASAPTTITDFTRATAQGVQEGHVLDVYLVDNNVTIAHGLDIRIGGTNISGAGQLIRMRCVGVFSGIPRFVSHLGQP